MTRRQTHVRAAGIEIMGLLSRRPDGMSAGHIAMARSMDKSQTRQTLNRLVELGLASIVRRKGPSGRVADHFQLTDKGREYLNAVMVDRVIPKPPKQEPAESEDESEDEEEVKWPRRDPEEIIFHAVQTQPNSVFDMARVMAC